MIFRRRGRRGDQPRQPRQPRRRGHLPSPVAVAVVAEVFALGLSVAANLAAVWGLGWVQRIAAVAIPAGLVIGAYLFLAHRFPVAWGLPRPGRKGRPAGRLGAERPARLARAGAPGWARWWANLAASVVILVPVATASYAHQRELLGATGSPAWIATLLPLFVDGLALRAALTLWFPPAVNAAASPATLEDEQGDEDANGGDSGDEQDDEQDDEQNEPPLPAVSGVDPDVVVAARTLLAAEPGLGRPRLRALLVEQGHPRLSDHACKAVLAALRPIRPVGSEAS